MGIPPQEHAVVAEDQEAPIAAPVAVTPLKGAQGAWPRSLRGIATGRPRWLVGLVTITVTLLFSYIALSNINFQLAWRAVRESDYWWIVAALIPFGLSILARALRWRSLFARGRRPGVGVVTDATMVGYLYNSILPLRAGEAARVVVLTQRSPVPPVEIVGTVVVERLYDV